MGEVLIENDDGLETFTDLLFDQRPHLGEVAFQFLDFYLCLFHIRCVCNMRFTSYLYTSGNR